MLHSVAGARRHGRRAALPSAGASTARPPARWPAFGLLLLLRFALLWVGIYLGLIAEGPESVAAVQILVWPIGFLSSAFVAPSTMPGWLGAIAEWNPLSATVDRVPGAVRQPGPTRAPRGPRSTAS